MSLTGSKTRTLKTFSRLFPIDLSSDIICEFEKDEDPYIWEVFSYANY
jgi:hypothetical protein